MTRKRLRSPQEKKALSFARDRRNTYGENDKASRKLIPLRKARENRQDRRKTAQEVSRLPHLDEQSADVLESSIRHDMHRVGGWKKVADQPLGKIVAWAKEAREKRAERNARKRAPATPDDPDELLRLARRSRRLARWFARSLRIGIKASDRSELEALALEHAKTYEERANQITRERSRDV